MAAREDAAGLPRKRFEQLKLGRRELDDLSGALHAHAVDLEPQIARRDDLARNASPNSLVLIDEPEISLHVAWQKAFLDDMARIATLANLRFIIATHSPQVIGEWWDRSVELYTVRRNA
ncbi:MAG: AAA family ATPase [Chloroflexi bacterium]|nr:AAA family ATPase [Chloroflexota bacterium]